MHAIGVIFFFNTSTIVLCQLWVLNRIEGKSRTRVLGVVSGLWFIFWLILETTLGTAGDRLRTAALSCDDRLRDR